MQVPSKKLANHIDSQITHMKLYNVYIHSYTVATYNTILKSFMI